MSAKSHSIDDEEKAPKVDERSNEVKSLDGDEEFGGAEARLKLEKKLLLKLDARMSILVVIYILNYVDRNNASSARLKGFSQDLHLVGQQFNTLLSILYVGYILMQIPSNMFLNHIGRPSLYMPICMMIWGAISILTGITKGFIGALLTRFFLGFVEAAFFPGSLFLISKWYTRRELGLRMCLLYCGSIISNAFGSLLATGILDGMQGVLGRAAWRWLFYIEGSLTVAVAFVSIFILPDFPTNTRWLTPLERKLALRRMEEDGAGLGDQAETENQKPASGFWLAVTDRKVWWMTVMLTAQVTGLSFNAFFPTLTATLGFNTTISLLLVAPPFIVTAVAAFFWSRHSDKTGERMWHIVLPFVVGIIGFIIAIATMNTAARYVSLFLMALSYCGYVVMFAWISNTNPRPPSKRAVALALTNCLSQLGNIAGSYVWQSFWGPSYRNSHAICISCFGLSIIMAFVMRRHLRSLNDRLDKEEGLQKKSYRYPL